MCTVPVMKGAECGTDRRRVRGKMKLRIKRKVRSNGIKVPKRIDVSKLGNSLRLLRKQILMEF